MSNIIINTDYDFAEYIDDILHWTFGGHYEYYSGLSYIEAVNFVNHVIKER